MCEAEPSTGHPVRGDGTQIAAHREKFVHNLGVGLPIKANLRKLLRTRHLLRDRGNDGPPSGAGTQENRPIDIEQHQLPVHRVEGGTACLAEHAVQNVTPRNVQMRQRKVPQSAQGYPSEARSSLPHERQIR